MRIGVLGTGTIATAVVRGIATAHDQITVSVRNAQNAQTLAQEFNSVCVANNQTVLDQSDVILLGLMAQDAPEILSVLRFRSDQLVISMMAGATLSELAPHVAPARAAAIMVPFPGIAAGESPVIAQGDIGLVGNVVTSANTVHAVQTDDELSAYLCAQAVLSPVACLVDDAAKWLGTRVSDPDTAQAFIRQLVSSSLTNNRADALITALNTPGGYNQQLRIMMENSGMRSAILDGLTQLEGRK
jgi:pyrroline-5-carboxylate reductase